MCVWVCAGLPSLYSPLCTHVIPDNVVNNWRIEAANIDVGWLCLARGNNWAELRKWSWLAPPLPFCHYASALVAVGQKRKRKLKGCAKARAKQSRKHLTEWNTSKQMKVSKHKTSHTANSQRERQRGRKGERESRLNKAQVEAVVGSWDWSKLKQWNKMKMKMKMH